MKNTTQTKTGAAAGVVIAVAVMLIATESQAYQLRYTDGGSRIRWSRPEITFILDDSLEQLGSIDDVEQVIRDSFDQWLDQAALPFDFKVVRGECSEPGYFSGAKNENCLLVDNDYWEAGDDAGATAVVSYSSGSGAIVDGDIVFNAREFLWSLDGSGDALDLAAVSMHEIGHLLGLKHSEIEDARMAPSIHLGNAGRYRLHGDDLDGATELYHDLEIEGDISVSGCDGMASTTPGAPSGWPAVMGFLAALWLIRRAQPYRSAQR